MMTYQDLPDMLGTKIERDGVSHIHMQAGEVILLSTLCLHSSGVNTTGEPRRALSTCLMDGATRYISDGATNAFFEQFYTKIIILPRQARDRCNIGKVERKAFSQGATPARRSCLGTRRIPPGEKRLSFPLSFSVSLYENRR